MKNRTKIYLKGTRRTLLIFKGLDASQAESLHKHLKRANQSDQKIIGLTIPDHITVQVVKL